jgi:hypothetical protein
MRLNSKREIRNKFKIINSNVQNHVLNFYHSIFGFGIFWIEIYFKRLAIRKNER